MNEKELEKIAKKIYITPSKEVINSLVNEYNFLKQNLEELKKINIDNIEPMTRISPKIDFNDLREDLIDASMYLKKEDLLKNAKDKNEDFVLIKRIVK